MSAKRLGRKQLLTLFLYAWECCILPFIINQTILRYQDISNYIKLSFILTCITTIFPHFVMLIIHNLNIVDTIPDIPSNKKISRSLRRGWLVYANTILDFLVHFLVYLYAQGNYLRHRAKIIPNHLYSNYFFDFFIPCFVMEIVYDFIYYFWHYYGHKNKFLWKHIHCIHHEIKYPCYWDVYHMSMWETWFLRISIFLLHSWFGFLKNKLVTVVMIQHFILFIEFVGHSGCQLTAADVSLSRFFLSKVPYIGINVVHHDYHHQMVGTNYSKRLGIWDRVFGTFYDPQIVQTKVKKKSVENEETCCDFA